MELKYNPQRARELIEESGVFFPGDVIVVHLKEKPETFGDTGILRPETHTPQPLIGSVVAFGTLADTDRCKGIDYYDQVVMGYHDVKASNANWELEDIFVHLAIISTKGILAVYPEGNDADSGS